VDALHVSDDVHYDVLRGRDYLRSAGLEPDERTADRLGFPLETEIGRARRWNTMRAMRG